MMFCSITLRITIDRSTKNKTKPKMLQTAISEMYKSPKPRKTNYIIISTHHLSEIYEKL